MLFIEAIIEAVFIIGISSLVFEIRMAKYLKNK